MITEKRAEDAARMTAGAFTGVHNEIRIPKQKDKRETGERRRRQSAESKGRFVIL